MSFFNMRPSLQALFPLSLRRAGPCVSAAGLALALSACGGGGGGAGSPAGQAAATPLSALMAPADFPQTVQAPSAPSSSQWQKVAAAVAQLPADSGSTWVLFTSTGAQGETLTLALLRWDPSQKRPLIQTPASDAAVHFEAYNGAGSVSGTL